MDSDTFRGRGLKGAVVVLLAVGMLAAVGCEPRPGPRLEKYSVSISKSAARVELGESVRISGSVKPFKPGKKMSLQRRIGGSWRDIRSTLANSAGRYSFTISPKTVGRNAYRVRAPRSTIADGAASKGVTIVVYRKKYSVTISKSAARVEIGKSATISGSVSPFKAGKTMYLQKRIWGTWRDIRPTLADSAGRYSFTISPNDMGANAYRVRAPGSTIAVGAVSTGVTIVVFGPVDPLATSAGWLETLNYYRTTSGSPPVLEETALNGPIMKHLIYLRDTPSEYFVGAYTNLHRENPASPYYTPEGAGYSHNVLTFGAATERAAIESWMTAPFHALNLLKPGANRAGFNQLGYTAAALTTTVQPPPPAPTEPIIFPGNESTTALSSFRGESPDPREPCPDFRTWRGLPLIVRLPYDPPTGVSAQMTLPDGSAVATKDLCVVTEDTFVTSDPVYGPAGRSILDSNNAVLIIPRDPLTPGAHDVALTLPGHDRIDWSFSVAV